MKIAKLMEMLKKVKDKSTENKHIKSAWIFAPDCECCNDRWKLYIFTYSSCNKNVPIITSHNSENEVFAEFEKYWVYGNEEPEIIWINENDLEG